MPQPRKRRRPPPARAAAYDVADASGGLTAAELSSLCITGRAATLHRAVNDSLLAASRAVAAAARAAGATLAAADSSGEAADGGGGDFEHGGDAGDDALFLPRAGDVPESVALGIADGAHLLQWQPADMREARAVRYDSSGSGHGGGAGVGAVRVDGAHIRPRAQLVVLDGEDDGSMQPRTSDNYGGDGGGDDYAASRTPTLLIDRFDVRALLAAWRDFAKAPRSVRAARAAAMDDGGVDPSELASERYFLGGLESAKRARAGGAARPGAAPRLTTLGSLAAETATLCEADERARVIAAAAAAPSNPPALTVPLLPRPEPSPLSPPPDPDSPHSTAPPPAALPPAPPSAAIPRHAAASSNAKKTPAVPAAFASLLASYGDSDAGSAHDNGDLEEEEQRVIIEVAATAPPAAPLQPPPPFLAAEMELLCARVRAGGASTLDAATAAELATPSPRTAFLRSWSPWHSTWLLRFNEALRAHKLRVESAARAAAAGRPPPPTVPLARPPQASHTQKGEPPPAASLQTKSDVVVADSEPDPVESDDESDDESLSSASEQGIVPLWRIRAHMRGYYTSDDSDAGIDDD